MAKVFYISSGAKPDQYTDNVSIGDVVTYQFDLTPWQEANSTVTTVDWTNEAGQGSIADDALVSGVASANITFNQAGRNIITLLINTATQKKKIWLEVYVKDVDHYADDYGIND